MNNEHFITDVAVVSGKGKCPEGYTILNATISGSDANLYEASFLKPGDRYICFSRIQNSATIVTDLNIIKEKDSIPPGFTAVKTCANDASEKALRKHLLCLKRDDIQKATGGVANILAVQSSKGERSPGNFYTISYDVNGINICYQTMPNLNARRPPPYGHHMTYRPPNIQPSHSGHQPGLPYPTGGHHMPVPGSLQGTAPPTHNQPPSPGSKQTSAIQGVKFQVNPTFELLWKKPNILEKTFGNRSIDDIERKYQYTFETETTILTSR